MVLLFTNSDRIKEVSTEKMNKIIFLIGTTKMLSPKVKPTREKANF